MSIVEVWSPRKVGRAGCILAIALAAAGWRGAAATAPTSSAGVAPAAALARLKEAMGGSAWDGVRSSHSRARIETGGLKGTTEGFSDLLTGRHYETLKLGPITGAEGWDGRSGWTQDSSGQSKRMEGGDEVEGAVNQAYRRCLAYWYPDRWPATVEDGGTHETGGRRFQVVKITPRGGRLFEIWIDVDTWLLDHVVEKQALETRTTFFSDYRAADGRKIAFAVRSTNGETKYDEVFAVDSVEFDVPLDESKFPMPGPPPPDFAFADGKTATTLPFELINNHIYVKVKLNGQGPFRLLCDTGGMNVITPTLAARLGVKPEGALEGRGVGETSEDVGLVNLESLSVGDVTIRKPLFAVFALESFADVEGVPQAGLIGYEVFKRFVVRVDYEQGRLTLTEPSAFAYEGSGTVVLFRFNEQIPQVDGSIDGIPGRFNIDTGSRGSLSLLKPFAEKNDLKKKLAARYEAVTGWGVGGPARGLIVRARELRLGDVSILSPVAELSLQQKGSFTDPYVAGNVGAGALKRFNLVFDYPGQRIIFEPNANNALPDVWDRSGMWVNRAGTALTVVDVTRGGPAEAAGLRAGDTIVAVDGAPVDDATLVALRRRFRAEPAGTKIILSVVSGDRTRDVRLVLKNLI